MRRLRNTPTMPAISCRCSGKDGRSGSLSLPEQGAIHGLLKMDDGVWRKRIILLSYLHCLPTMMFFEYFTLHLLAVGWCERPWPVLGSYCFLEPKLLQNPPRLIGCGRQPRLAGSQDGRSVEWGCQWLHAAPLMIPTGAPPVPARLVLLSR